MKFSLDTKDSKILTLSGLRSLPGVTFSTSELGMEQVLRRSFLTSSVSFSVDSILQEVVGVIGVVETCKVAVGFFVDSSVEDDIEVVAFNVVVVTGDDEDKVDVACVGLDVSTEV